MAAKKSGRASSGQSSHFHDAPVASQRKGPDLSGTTEIMLLALKDFERLPDLVGIPVYAQMEALRDSLWPAPPAGYQFRFFIQIERKPDNA